MCDNSNPQESTHIIGVISDTHSLVRPEVLAALKNVEMVIHAGDIGSPEVLDALRNIAPITAVRGNMDKGVWASRLPKKEVVRIGSALIYVLHDLHELDLDPAAAGFAAVISGHSHMPLKREHSGVIFLNPGSAGPRRFALPVSLAFLRIQGCSLSVEFEELDV